MASSEAFGLRDIRRIVVPHPVSTLDAEQLVALEQEALPHIVGRLVVD
ncbi:MAG: hypothetical protein HY329_10370 [Chloroflexi bacterium]|nr:hypothetical protein [Chloroflexota bacterium]